MAKKSKVTRKSKRTAEATSTVELVPWVAKQIEGAKRGKMSPVQVGAALLADLEDLATANVMSRDQAAFEAIVSTLEALPEGLAGGARFDLRDAPKPVLDFAVRATPYAAHFRAFEPIKPGSAVALELMVLAVCAGRYIRQQVDLEEAIEDRAVVDKALIEKASRHLASMLGLLAHNFEDDERMAARIDALKAGRSHEKLRFGLAEAAKLYRSHRAFLANDKNRFKLADARIAAELANDIGLQLDLGRSRSSQAWRDLAQRAASVLLAAHAHVRAMMVLIHVGQVDDPNETFPSLRSLVASASGGRTTEVDDAAEAPKPNGVPPAVPGDA